MLLRNPELLFALQTLVFEDILGAFDPFKHIAPFGLWPFFPSPFGSRPSLALGWLFDFIQLFRASYEILIFSKVG